ncbi:polyprenyl synthetase [Planctomycetaceae bacterium SCGC AG-212-F19]|nr:polyprenyl synthetase [Planctomycetaceae bacterium SCGC AG-212-F19]
MATVAELEITTNPAPKDTRRPSTAHLKAVPQTREVRDQVRAAAADFGKTLDRSRPLTRPVLQQMAENLLRQLALPESYLGFTMVVISNEFWREQVQAIDFKRRLLLLPHCLKHAEGCPADYDEFGLDCRKCGACSVADFKTKAEDLGYKVLVSEGTPIVLKIIVSGHIDAIVGVACLNVLEKALDKVLLAGVPSVAVPLLSSNCKTTSVDEDWVMQLIDLRSEPPKARTRTYVHLMRAANQMFEEPELSRLAPRLRHAPSSNPPSAIPQLQSRDPLAKHEQIAYDWLAQGGKRSRPFITLAAYDALKGAPGTLAAEGLNLPDGVRRAALAIETFHKASLVHDDIEDDDSFRYGQETLHRQFGVPAAINIGDYLIGLGYRLVGRDRKELGGDCAADILNRLAEAHLKLSEGQGAELLWRDAADKVLTPLDALKIYALKTAPAFEAALYAGIRLAGSAEPYEKMVAEFSKNLGVAFQILNDLKDWEGDSDNKLVAGQDALAARPTLLLALALEGASAAERAELLALLGTKAPGLPSVGLARMRSIFERAAVFAKAEKLVEKYRARAEALADETQPAELRELLYFLVDTVLDRQPPPEPEVHALPLIQLST